MQAARYFFGFFRFWPNYFFGFFHFSANYLFGLFLFCIFAGVPMVGQLDADDINGDKARMDYLKEKYGL